MGNLRRLKRSYKICWLLVVFIIGVFLFTTPDPSYTIARGVERSDAVKSFPNSHFKEKAVKKILKWTGMFQRVDNEGDIKCLKSCKFACEIVSDKAKIKDVDAVHFHLSDVWSKVWRIGTKSLIEFPKYRSRDQLWILSNMEPPPHLWGDINILNGLFNWTNWYRDDADIVWPYGEKYILSGPEQEEAKEKLKKRNFFKEKTKEIAVRVSNCFDPGQRYRIISQIAKRVNVDGYGKCYSRMCGKSMDPDDHSCDDELKQYKFYLAFENDLCRDYITEKYWFTLKRDQIPIVNWKRFNKSKVIPNSYINIHDFETIEQFISFIKIVSSNETLYNSYFEHRKFYKQHRTSCNMCEICKVLHDKTKPAQIYMNLDGWIRDDTCDKVQLWNNFLKNFYGWRFYLFGF